MSIYEKMKLLRIKYRKERNTDLLTIISTLIGEIERVSPKGAYDATVISILKKQVKTLNDAPVNSRNVMELELINQFLPTEMSEEEIIHIMEDIPFDDIGSFMKYMQNEFSGKYDGKLAAKLWKEYVA